MKLVIIIENCQSCPIRLIANTLFCPLNKELEEVETSHIHLKTRPYNCPLKRFDRRKRKTFALLERKTVYSLEYVFSKVIFDKKKNESEVDFDGDRIYMNSQRYQTFKKYGVKCIKCGIEGKFFAKERHYSNSRYHLNLYAVNEFGHEILMTKDHIIPLAKGGKDQLDNLQPMCVKCNNKKGES